MDGFEKAEWKQLFKKKLNKGSFEKAE